MNVNPCVMVFPMSYVHICVLEIILIWCLICLFVLLWLLCGVYHDYELRFFELKSLTSHLFPLHSGVSQSSVLGPQLFTICLLPLGNICWKYKIQFQCSTPSSTYPPKPPKPSHRPPFLTANRKFNWGSPTTLSNWTVSTVCLLVSIKFTNAKINNFPIFKDNSLVSLSARVKSLGEKESTSGGPPPRPSLLA